MKIFETIGISSDYVLLGVGGVTVLLFILVIVLFLKNSKLNKKYNAFMQGNDGQSLEELVKTRFEEIDTIKEIIKKQQEHLEALDESHKMMYQKCGIVRYDAFKEMGGKLSFVIALLNKDNTGFILNSMNTREGCYNYIKEIIRGESYVVLAEEEQEALQQAMKSTELIQ